MSESARVFVAILFPSDVRTAIARQTAELRGGDPALKPVREEQIHLTLRFLGDTPRARLDEVAARLCEVAAEIEPFELDVEGAGAFPGARRPVVLWAGVRESDALETLHETVEETLVSLGLGRDDRPFHPHVTVARVRRGGGTPPHLREALAGAVVRAAVRVASIALVESVLGPGGARHEVLERCRLGSRRPS